MFFVDFEQVNVSWVVSSEANVSEQLSIFLKLHYFPAQVSTHCKTGSKHAVAMLLYQTYCFTCIYNQIKFHCWRKRGF